MARVAIRKAQASLDEFGVPRQPVAVRPQVPSVEELEQFKPEIALTPEQYTAKVPLMDRTHWGDNEGFGRDRSVGEEYLEGMGQEGALAAGEMMRDYPALKERSVTDEVKHLPFIRDYYSRQTTLPELPGFESYQTAGPHFDEEGNIIPGQIPPVNAIKILSRGDVEGGLSRAGNFGLMPMNLAQNNLRWERENVPEHGMFPVSRASFVAPATTGGVKDATPGNTYGDTSVIGIRGFGTPSDKAFFRNQTNERAEGIFTEAIPPERLVGVFGPSGTKQQGPVWNRFADWPANDYTVMEDPYTGAFRSGGQKSFHTGDDLLEAVYDGKPPQGANIMTGAHALYDRGELSPLDMAMLAIYGGKQEARRLNENQRTEAQQIHYDTAKRMDRSLRPRRYNAFGHSDKFTGRSPHSVQDASYAAYRKLIPEQFKHGVFGFENPLLTEQEKKDMMDQLGYQLRGHDQLDAEEREFQRERDPSVPGLEHDIYGPGKKGEIILRPRKYMEQL